MNDTVSSFAEGVRPMDFMGFRISALGQMAGPVRKGTGMCPRCLARRFEDPRGRPVKPLVESYGQLRGLRRLPVLTTEGAVGRVREVRTGNLAAARARRGHATAEEFLLGRAIANVHDVEPDFQFSRFSQVEHLGYAAVPPGERRSLEMAFAAFRVLDPYYHALDENCHRCHIAFRRQRLRRRTPEGDFRRRHPRQNQPA